MLEVAKANHLIKLRRVVHFSGFEPLDYLAHQVRYKRALSLSARTFGFKFKVGKTVINSPLFGVQSPEFSVSASGPNWQTETLVTVLEHSDLIIERLAIPLWQAIPRGFYAALKVVLYGGLVNYARTAWRMACFFVFPFLFMAIGLTVAALFATVPLLLGLSPVNLIWSFALAPVFFAYVFLPFAKRFHILLLFANCRMAVELVGRKSQRLKDKQLHFAQALAQALKQPADEYVIASHSMGGSLMIEALGDVLLANPNALAGKQIVICSMGGAGFQCTLMRPAHDLRKKALLLLENPNIIWMDVQCLTDFVSFYKVSFSSAFKMPNAKNAKIIFIRMKHMLTATGYKRLKKDGLLLHRQYVLGSEVRSKFDFSLLTAGPFPAARFLEFSNQSLPPLGPDGAIIG